MTAVWTEFFMLSLPSLPFFATRFRSRGFSLVEVTLAIGVAAFCLIVMLGLLPAGLNANRDGAEQTVATGLVAAVAADLRSSAAQGSRFGFQKGAALQTQFVAEDGAVSSTLVSGGSAPSRYRVTIQRGTAGGLAAVPLRIIVSWPAAADPVPTDWPAKFSGSVEVVTALSP